MFEYVRDDDGKVHDSLVLQKWSYDYKLLLFNYLVIGLLWDILSTPSVKKTVCTFNLQWTVVRKQICFAWGNKLAKLIWGCGQ